MSTKPWSIKVVRLIPVENGGQVVALADVRIYEIIVYGFRINRDEEGRMWVSNPQVEIDGRFQDTMGFLDIDVSATLSEVVIDEYLHPYPESSESESR